jgi:hypothetical protein
MKVRFARWVAAGVTCFAVAVDIVGLVLLLVGAGAGAAVPVLVAGLVATALGATYFGPLPYFVVRDREVVMPVMLFGLGHARLGRGDRLRIRDGRLLIRRIQGGEDPALGIRQSMAHAADWQALAKLINTDTRPTRQG